MKNFKGKAIYNPSGKAGEYSYWACNFYVGCSNGCKYCYLKKGRCAKITGGEIPRLKKCFKSPSHALAVFERELKQNLSELQKHGLFFSFTTDPCLPETWLLTCQAICICRDNNVPFKILTKRTDWLIDEFLKELEINGTIWNREPKQHLWAFGFTLTGHDELEIGASTNMERVAAMRKLHDAGFKTFASIEPIIDFNSSMYVIERTLGWCDLYKIGLMSGQKVNKQFKTDLTHFVGRVCMLAKKHDTKVYWKDSITKIRDIVSEASVGVDYNLFGNGR